MLSEIELITTQNECLLIFKCKTIRILCVINVFLHSSKCIHLHSALFFSCCTIIFPLPLDTMSGSVNRESWRDAARPKQKELFQIQEVLTLQLLGDGCAGHPSAVNIWHVPWPQWTSMWRFSLQVFLSPVGCFLWTDPSCYYLYNHSTW